MSNTAKMIFIASLASSISMLGFVENANAKHFGGFGGLMRPAAPFAGFRATGGMVRPMNMGQTVLRGTGTGITSANCWNSGTCGQQPYQRYSNDGIGQANCWNAGCNQPYNQYTNVINP